MTEIITKKKLNLRAYHHVMDYPIVKEVSDFSTSFSFVKLFCNQISSLLNQILSYLSSFELIVSYGNLVDSILDGWLKVLDENVPFVKTFSFSSSYQSFSNSINSNYQAVSKTVQPYFDSVVKFFDPVLKVTNDYYEYILNLILPYSKVVEKEIQEGEVIIETQYHRMLKLIGETYNRMHSTASNVSKIPSHVSTTYRNELKESNSTTQAVSNTTRKLSTDAYQTIKPTLDRVVGVTSTTTTKVSDEVVDKVEPVVAELKESVAHATGVEVH